MSMMWKKVSRNAGADGSLTIRYECGEYAVESRKRPIPHANGDGHWMHTSYFLIRPDGTEKEYWGLRAAKAAAEECHGRQ